MKPISLSNKVKLDTTTISNQFIDTYMAKTNGEYIKVFLMLLRLLQGGENPSADMIAKRLDMTERAVLRALFYWEKEGLLFTENHTNGDVAATKETKAQKDQVPVKSMLTPADLKQKQTDTNFSHLKYITEMYLGHPMTNTEINSLSYIYDDLKLPMDLIEYLIEYCVSNHKSNLRYMEKVAIDWHKKGIKTPQQAKSQSASYSKDYYSIMHAMGLKNQPAPAQIEFMEKWLYTDAHSLNLILEACRRTITAIGKPSFPYASKILDSWKKAGIRSVRELTTYDSKHAVPKTSMPPKQPKKTNIHNFHERSYDFDELEQRYIQKINK
ncbi:MAG: DnaD domain protein [Lachnospiraceae bacterium]|nr:DnaD domain protein [Lachnospiraceae bacterium]